MALYLLQRDGISKVDGVKAMVVEANSSTEAKALANSWVDGDGGWSGATVTTLSAGQSADMEGWKYRIMIGKTPAFTVGHPDVVDVEYTAIASDTVDSIGDALVVLLNATSQIAGAAYNPS